MENQQRTNFSSPSDVTEASACTNCKVTALPLLKLHRDVVKSVTSEKIVSVPFAKSRGKLISRKCAKIIDQSGRVGPIGKILQNEILAEYPAEFLDGQSLRPVCPNFSKMNREQQLQAWTWLWMVLANEESNCEPDTFHPYQGWGTTEGWGLYAAEYNPLRRLFRGFKCIGDIRQVDLQVKCAVSTMAKMQFGRGQKVLDDDSYWGPIRRYKKQIQPNMSLHKACFAKEEVHREKPI